MKIKLTESQVERLASLLKEDEANAYNKEVIVDVDYYGATYNGHEIDDIGRIKTRLYFNIDIEYRSWGISGFYLYNLRGPEQLEFDLRYYIDDENTEIATLPLKMNWGVLDTENYASNSSVTIGDKLDIKVKNGPNGELVIDSMTIDVYS